MNVRPAIVDVIVLDFYDCLGASLVDTL